MLLLCLVMLRFFKKNKKIIFLVKKQGTQDFKVGMFFKIVGGGGSERGHPLASLYRKQLKMKSIKKKTKKVARYRSHFIRLRSLRTGRPDQLADQVSLPHHRPSNTRPAPSTQTKPARLPFLPLIRTGTAPQQQGKQQQQHAPAHPPKIHHKQHPHSPA